MLAPSLPTRIPRVDQKVCRSCPHCPARQVCRSKALRAVDPGEPPWVDGNRCYGCLACAMACTYGAITF